MMALRNVKKHKTMEKKDNSTEMPSLIKEC